MPAGSGSVNDDALGRLAELLTTRNEIDAEIGRAIGRPMTSGHLGEFIASSIFQIELEQSATSPAVDGRFLAGLLAGNTVNVKWYLKREGMLDVSISDALDYYLVFTGPTSRASRSGHSLRPWVITNVYLFDARAVRDGLLTSGRRVGTASSVTAQQWAAAEAYPKQHPLLPLSPSQQQALALFHPPL